MTTFIVHEGALGIDNDLSVPFCLEEEESVATAQEKKAQKTTQRISMAMLILGTLSLGYTVVKDYVGGRSSDKRLGNIETSLRVLTQTVAPQIYKSIDDSLRSALTQNGPDSARSLAGAQANMKQLQALNVRLDAKQLMQSGDVLANVTLAHPELGEVWATSGQLISYRSQSSATAPSPEQVDCATENGTALPLVPPGPPGSTRALRLNYANCTLVIDDEAGFERGGGYKELLEIRKQYPSEGFALRLYQVRVIYRGRPLIGAAFVEFHNCTFEFQVPKIVPSDDGKKLVRELLYADLDQPTTINFKSGM